MLRAEMTDEQVAARRASANSWYARNRARVSAAAKQRRNDPVWAEKERQRSREKSLRETPEQKALYLWTKRLRQYGLSEDGFLRLWARQRGLCPGCGNALLGDRLTNIDHCHATGRVRGLLCAPCNRALGHAQDSPLRMRHLADYVEAARAC